MMRGCCKKQLSYEITHTYTHSYTHPSARTGKQTHTCTHSLSRKQLRRVYSHFLMQNYSSRTHTHTLANTWVYMHSTRKT